MTHLMADRRLLSCASRRKKKEETRRKTKTTKPGRRLVIFLVPIQSFRVTDGIKHQALIFDSRKNFQLDKKPIQQGFQDLAGQHYNLHQQSGTSIHDYIFFFLLREIK